MPAGYSQLPFPGVGVWPRYDQPHPVHPQSVHPQHVEVDQQRLLFLVRRLDLHRVTPSGHSSEFETDQTGDRFVVRVFGQPDPDLILDLVRAQQPGNGPDPFRDLPDRIFVAVVLVLLLRPQGLFPARGLKERI